VRRWRGSTHMKQAKSFWAEFKQFISRGNVIDLAVGVIIGGAFTAIVNSLVNDVVMPVIGILFGGIDFTGLKYVITPASGDTPEAAIYYGNFIQNVVNFLLVAFRSEEHTSELQSRFDLVCRLLLEKKNDIELQRT